MLRNTVSRLATVVKNQRLVQQVRSYSAKKVGEKTIGETYKKEFNEIYTKQFNRRIDVRNKRC